MMENFPKLMSDTKTQIQETQTTARRINIKNKTKHNTKTKTQAYHFKPQQIKDKEKT